MEDNELNLDSKIRELVEQLNFFDRESLEEFLRFGTKSATPQQKELIGDILEGEGLTEQQVIEYLHENKDLLESILSAREQDVEQMAEDILNMIDGVEQGDTYEEDLSPEDGDLSETSDGIAQELLNELDRQNVESQEEPTPEEEPEPEQEPAQDFSIRPEPVEQPVPELEQEPQEEPIPEEEPEPEQEPQPQPAPKPRPEPQPEPKSKKAQKLDEKVNKLIEKIEKEKNPIKRHVLAFRVKLLMSKIQKEIDLQNLKEGYNLKREALKRDKEQGEIEASEGIPETVANIKHLKNLLYSNEEYDYGSPSFMYPDNHVKNVGGIDKLTQNLKNSPKVSSQLAAAKIEQMAQARQELERLEKELKEQQELLNNGDKKYKKEARKLDFEQTALVVRDKVNIFSRIGNFFGKMKEEIKSYFDERKEDKELAKLQKIKESEIKAQYAQAMKEIKEQGKAELEAKRDEQGKDAAAKFRSQISDFIPVQEEAQQEEESAQDRQSEPIEQEDDAR